MKSSASMTVSLSYGAQTDDGTEICKSLHHNKVALMTADYADGS